MKLKSLLTSLAMLLSCVSVTAHHFEADGIYYKVLSYADKTLMVTCKGDNYDSYLEEYCGAVKIPETVIYSGETYKVISIEEYAFSDCYMLRSVIIPNSVTSMGNGAFSGCYGLESVEIGDGLTGISHIAFSDCEDLKSVTIGKSVTSIGNRAFSFCSSLKSIVIPNSVVSIGVAAFEYSGLTYVSIPNSVKNIESEAFKYCEEIASVVIPNGIIGNSAFRSCSGLTSVEIGDSVTSIGGSAFAYCRGLTSVEIGNNVTSIGGSAFAGCSSLTSVEIPNSVTSIWGSTFEGCSGLTSIIVDEDNPIYDSRDGCNSIIETSSNTLIASCQSSVIPSSVTSIGAYAFSRRSDLTSVELGNGVTSIGKYAFQWCTGLASVEIPISLSGIGYDAFYECNGLDSVNIEDVSAWCNIKFTGERSNPLCHGATLYLNGENVINLVIPDNVNNIGDWAFDGCSGLTSVVIPNNVTSIGTRTFHNCSDLTSVEIGNGVTSIGSNAFSCCSDLTSVEIPNSVICIGDSAFSSCLGLTSVEIGTGVTSIGYYAFAYCRGLTSVEIPNSVNSIRRGAFSGCSGLTSVVVGNGVTSIGRYAFDGCYGLTSITSLSQTPPTVEYRTFTNYDATLYVPYGSKTAYSTAEYWKDFTNIIELKPSYELTVSDAGYATLYLDYSTEIPEGLEVYVAKEVAGNVLKMELVEDVLPANTGVVVKAPAGTYTFAYSDTDAPAIADNLFMGSAENTYIDVPSNSKAFVLSKVDGEVGMYLAKLTDGRFLNNANKAYLLLDGKKLGLSDDELDTSVGGAQLSLRFNFGGATSIDNLPATVTDGNVIYDLYGRKLNSVTTPGLYIVNGKKVWVK